MPVVEVAKHVDLHSTDSTIHTYNTVISSALFDRSELNLEMNDVAN